MGDSSPELNLKSTKSSSRRNALLSSDGEDSDETPIKRPRTLARRRLSSSSSGSSSSTIIMPLRKKRRFIAASSESSDDSGPILGVRPRLIQRSNGAAAVISDSDTAVSESESSNECGVSEKAEARTHSEKDQEDSSGFSDSDGREVCIICFKTLRSPVAQPSGCCHYFHTECLSTWSKTSNTCPIDRVKYKTIQVKHVSGGDIVERIEVNTPPPQDHNADIEPDDPTFCEVCHQNDRESEMLLCDECDAGYHIYCLDPPLSEIPMGNWFCPNCSESILELEEESRELLRTTEILEDRLRERPERQARRTDVDTRHRRVLRTLLAIRQSSQPSTSSGSTRASSSNRQSGSSTRPSRSTRQSSSNRTTSTNRSNTRTRTRGQGTKYKVQMVTTEDGSVIEVVIAVKSRSKRKSKKTKKRGRRQCPRTSGEGSGGGPESFRPICPALGSRSLDLFGTRPTLDYFSGCEAEDELEEEGGGGVAGLRRARTAIRGVTNRKQAAQILHSTVARRRPVLSLESRPAADVLSSILDEQAKWHNPRAQIVSNSKGEVMVSLPKGTEGVGARQAQGSGDGPSEGTGSAPVESANGGGVEAGGSATEMVSTEGMSDGGNGGMDALGAQQPPQAPGPLKSAEDENDDIDLYDDIEAPPSPPQLTENNGSLLPPPAPPAMLLAMEGVEDGASSPETGLVIDDENPREAYDPDHPSSSPPPLMPPPMPPMLAISSVAVPPPLPKSLELLLGPSLDPIPPPLPPPRALNLDLSDIRLPSPVDPDNESDCPNDVMYSSTSRSIARRNTDEPVLSKKLKRPSKPVAPAPEPTDVDPDGASDGVVKFIIPSKQLVKRNVLSNPLFDAEASKEPEGPGDKKSKLSYAKGRRLGRKGNMGRNQGTSDPPKKRKRKSRFTDLKGNPDPEVVDDSEDAGNDEAAEPAVPSDEVGKDDVPVNADESQVNGQSPTSGNKKGGVSKDNDNEESESRLNIVTSDKSTNKVDDLVQELEDDIKETEEPRPDLNDSNGTSDAGLLDSSGDGAKRDDEPYNPEDLEDEEGDENSQGHEENNQVHEDKDNYRDWFSSSEEEEDLESRGRRSKVATKGKVSREHTEKEDLLELRYEGDRDGLVDITDEELSSYDRSDNEQDHHENQLGLEGLETEAISENEDVLEEGRNEKLVEDGSAKEEGEVVEERNDPSVPWKKLSKAKDRNYRDKELVEKRDKDKKKDKDKKPKEKRKDLERYDIRRVISEKPKRKTDEFGRDISLSRSRSRSRSRSNSLSLDRERRKKRRKSRSESRGRKRVRSRSRSPGRRAGASRDRGRSRERRVRSMERPRQKSADRLRFRSTERSRYKNRERSLVRAKPRSKERGKKSRDKSRGRLKSRDRDKRRRKSLSSSCSSCSCSSCEREKRDKLTVVVPNKSAKVKKNKKKGKGKKKGNKRRRITISPVPSKEVFTSGDNILVSVNFKSTRNSDSHKSKETPFSVWQEEQRRKKDKSSKENQPLRSVVSTTGTPHVRKRREALKNLKPVAIIDLAQSPFREQPVSPKDIIVLTDSESEDKHGEEMSKQQSSTGPKTPPEPSHIKFSIAAAKPAASRSLANPILDSSAAEEAGSGIEKDLLHKGPNTPPSPPPSAPYDPFEPTKSRSPTPGPLPQDVLRNPSPPKELGHRVLQPEPLKASSTVSPPKLLLPHSSPKTPSPLHSPRPAKPPTDHPDSADKSKPPKPPLPYVTNLLPINCNDDMDMFSPGGGDSPYSPGSSEGDDLFEPPVIAPTPTAPPKSKARVPAAQKMLKMPLPTPLKRRPASHSTPAKGKGGQKKEIAVRLNEDQLKILDELPNSAVEMQVKDKYLKKLNRQERVVEEVKLVLKPHYARKHVTKEEYKDILRKAVPKICHSRSGEINPMKIQNLIEAYVKKYRHKRKKAQVAQGIAPPSKPPLKPKQKATMWS